MTGLPGQFVNVEEFCKEHGVYCGNEDCGRGDGHYGLIKRSVCEYKDTCSDDCADCTNNMETACQSPAIWRLQGETGAGIAEYHYLCQICKDAHVKAVQEWQESPESNELRQCDWCEAMVPARDLRWQKDFEEGSAAVPGHICPDCYASHAKYVQENFVDDDDYNDYDLRDEWYEQELQDEKDRIEYERERDARQREIETTTLALIYKHVGRTVETTDKMVDIITDWNAFEALWSIQDWKNFETRDDYNKDQTVKGFCDTNAFLNE